MTAVKTYEKYAIEAAINGDDRAAYNAMMVHPLIGDFENSVACYKEMKDAHREFLPQFLGK